MDIESKNLPTTHSTNTKISNFSINTKELPTPPTASVGLKINNAQMGMAKQKEKHKHSNLKKQNVSSPYLRRRNQKKSTQKQEMSVEQTQVQDIPDQHKNSKKRTFTSFFGSSNAANVTAPNKKTKVTNLPPMLEPIQEDDLISIATNESGNQELTVEEQAEEKKEEEITEENIWKKDKKTRREFFCSNFPTLVITPVNGRSLLSESMLTNFLLPSNRKQIAKFIKVHTHSMSWRTVYVHFFKEISEDKLQQIANNFNDFQQNTESKEKEKVENEEEIILPKCSIFQRSYVEEKKKKRKEDACNPYINRCVLLKNVSLQESTKEIEEALKEAGYTVEKIERFKNQPVVKVMLETGEQVTNILQDNNLYIGYQKARCELFDPYRRRPRRHFRQCKKCFHLGHLAPNCNKKQVCKFCGRANHLTKDCKFKRRRQKHSCILCKGQHASDSLHCPIIQSVRKKLNISYSRKEIEIISQKQQRQQQKQQQPQKQEFIQSQRYNNSNMHGKQFQQNWRQKNPTQMMSYAAVVNHNQEVPVTKPSKIQRPNNSKEYIKGQYRRQPNNVSKNDEITALRAEISEIRSAMDQMSMLVTRLLSSFEQNNFPVQNQYQLSNNTQFSQILPITTTNQLLQ